jgi:hypothetical protein
VRLAAICSAVERDEYDAAAEALHWVRSSFLQMTRYAESFLDYAEARVPADVTQSDEASQEIDPELITRTVADAHFLLNACAQAEKALDRMGRPLPTSQTTTIRCLRNIHEHWEDHKQSFESRKNPKSKAGLKFDKAHPGALPWNFRFDITGTWISAFRIEDLWAELVGIEAELHELVAEHHTAMGFEPIPSLRERGEFQRRETRVLGMAMSTQTIVIDNANWGTY